MPCSRRCVRKKKVTEVVKEKRDTKRHLKGMAGPSSQLEIGDEGEEEIKRASNVSSLGDSMLMP